MTRKKYSRISSIAAFSILGLVLAGCGSDTTAEVASGSWEDLVEAAEQEGSISLYSIAPDVQNNRLEAAFAEEYPDINLQILRGGGELASRVEAERASGSGGADVFMFSDTGWFEDRQDELLELNGPNAENLNEDSWLGGQTAFVAAALPQTNIAWNTDIFPDGFENWEDLLSDEVSGQLGMRSEMTANLAGYYDFLENELGEEYIIELAEQAPNFYPSVVPMTQALGSGEIGVTEMGNIPTLNQLQEEGAPVDYVLPEPSYWLEWGAGAFENSSNPNASLLFMDFLMSVEGQTALNGDGYGHSSVEGVEGGLELDASDGIVFDLSEFPPERVAEYDEKFNEWFR